MTEQASTDTSVEFQTAGFWVRFGATLIDIVILICIFFLADAIFSLIVGYRVGLLADLEAELTVADRISEIISIVIIFLYFTVLESSSKQATIGKKLLNIKITDNSGERITYLRAAGRFFGKIVSFLVLMIGFLMIGWTKKKQGLHDKIAGTLVIVDRLEPLSEKLTDQVSIDTITEPRYAGFWVRFGATLIDIVILIIILFFADAIFSLIVGYRAGILADLEAELTDADSISGIISIVIIFLYFTVLESSSKQATIGKNLLNIKITDNSGERITYLRAAGRYFGKIVSFLLLMIGFLMIGWTKNKQGLHDKIAGTLVIVDRLEPLSGKVADQVSIDTITEPRYAGFWLRFGAMIIDAIFLVAVFFSIDAIFTLFVGYNVGMLNILEEETTNADRVSEITALIVGFLYVTITESSKMQGTFGKKALDLKVTNYWGERISFIRAAVRCIFSSLSSLILFIGYLMVIWTKKKQGLHDKIAGTLVIVDRKDSDKLN